MNLFDMIKAKMNKDYKNSVLRDNDIGTEHDKTAVTAEDAAVENIRDSVLRDNDIEAEADAATAAEDPEDESFGKSLLELFNASEQASSGEIITPERAFRNIEIVFACVDRRARALAKLPLQLYRKQGERREQIHDHPISYLLSRRPNRYQTPTMFKQFIVACQLLWGNAYILKEYNGKGEITSLLPIHPDEVSIEKLSDREEYIYRYNGLTYTEDEMIHIPYLSSEGKVGISPLRVAREAAGTLHAMNKHQGHFYKNGALMQGALIVPSAIGPNEKDILRREWSRLVGGSGNAGNTAILDGGMDWKNISMPLADAEFVANKKLSATEIATIFDVPAYMINDTEKMTYNNMEQQNSRWLLDVIQPDCINIEEELDYKLFLQSESDLFLKFNLDSALRADPKARGEYYKSMMEMSIYSINEVRAKEDMDDIGEIGDRHLVSLNYTTLESLEDYQADQKKEGSETQ